jgi:hypothetical protein
MQDGPDQQRVAGLLPVVSPFERAFRIDEHVGEIMHVTDFPFTSPDLDQRVVGGAVGIGRIEQQRSPETATTIAAMPPDAAL